MTIVLPVGLIHEKIAILQSRLSWFPKQSIRGIWAARYVAQRHGGHTYEVIQLFIVRQIGRSIYAEAFHGDQPHNVLKAMLTGYQYLTGTWKDKKRNSNYHGSFQLILSLGGETMEGQWVGFSSENYIKNGTWHWNKLEDKTDKRSREEAIRKHGATYIEFTRQIDDASIARELGDYLGLIRNPPTKRSG